MQKPLFEYVEDRTVYSFTEKKWITRTVTESTGGKVKYSKQRNMVEWIVLHNDAAIILQEEEEEE